jgi:small-conductance mechanosensitive channel
LGRASLSADESDLEEPSRRPSPRLVLDPGLSSFPDALRLQQENVRLKAELLKTQKQLKAVQEENRNLANALEKNEQLRARYKQQLAALQQNRQ